MQREVLLAQPVIECRVDELLPPDWDTQRSLKETLDSSHVRPR